MSRVAKYIDNGPMEGFWGILKRERYYDKRFMSREELVQMIEIRIYSIPKERKQKNLFRAALQRSECRTGKVR